MPTDIIQDTSIVAKGYMIYGFQIILAKILVTGDVVTTFIPGFVGSIQKLFWVQKKAEATGGKSATLYATINSVNVVGGLVTLTSATLTPMGKMIAGTAVTGSNVFDKDDTISIKSTVTVAFADSGGTLYIVCGVRKY